MYTNDAFLNVTYVEKNFDVADLDNSAWFSAEIVLIDRYWSTEPSPENRQFTSRLLWSDSALYVRFEAAQHEPLIMSDTPDLSQKSIGLWDRDVCEIFVAPDANRPEKYYEFEIAPTGEWLDVALEVTADGRKTDWDYHSNMSVASRVETDKVISAIKIPWPAFGRTPQTGDEWRGNLYRCIGEDPTRGYLAWRPTHTSEPSFHVPSKFGRLKFVE